MSRRINSAGSISRETTSAHVYSRASATYIHRGALHTQCLVNGSSHSGPRILQWSRGDETKPCAAHFPTPRPHRLPAPAGRPRSAPHAPRGPPAAARACRPLGALRRRSTRAAHCALCAPAARPAVLRRAEGQDSIRLPVAAAAADCRRRIRRGGFRPVRLLCGAGRANLPPMSTGMRRQSLKTLLVQMQDAVTLQH